MLFRDEVLDGIARGRVRLAFRRWQRARVRAGSRLRTSVGVLEIDAVEVVAEDEVTDADAHAAGFDSARALLAEVNRNGSGELHRIRLHLAGPDPRVALREQAHLTPEDAATLRARLARADAAADQPWTTALLRLLATHPGVRARDLAEHTGSPTDVLKRRARRLKDLGLVESLRTGYRLSPRGRAFLDAHADGA